jgi:predicted RNA binding protein YcfA (HicA-like mRNA interferase family)
MTKHQDYRSFGKVEIKVYKDMVVTYGEFIEALKQIGFKNESTSEHFRFKKKTIASLIKMPIRPLKDVMWTPNFFNYGQSLFLRGDIENPDDLAKIIEKNREHAKAELATA